MFFQRKRKILRKTLWHSRITTPVSSSSSTMAPTMYGHLPSPAPYCYPSGAADESVGSTNCCGVDMRQQRTAHRKSVNSRRGDASANSLANCCLNTACSSSSSSSSDNELTEQHQYRLYCALFDRLKSSQLSTLSDAVKHASGGQQTQQPPLVQQQHQHQHQHHQLAMNAGVASSNNVPYAQQQIPSTTSSDCILVQRDQIMGEEPHVIACRIWRWPDLSNADELKRIPSCPSGKDPVYVCCNPNHWSRTCKTGN
jgi:MH1 domain